MVETMKLLKIKMHYAVEAQVLAPAAADITQNLEASEKCDKKVQVLCHILEPHGILKWGLP